MHLHLSFVQALLLPVGTWLLYVADRILDGLRSGEMLRERHHFHARHRTTFLLVSALLVILLAYMVATHMRPEALRDDAWIGSFALLYLFAVHRTPARRLPKELAVALIFAFATVPNQTASHPLLPVHMWHWAETSALGSTLLWTQSDGVLACPPCGFLE